MFIHNVYYGSCNGSVIHWIQMFCRPALLLQSYALSRCMTSFVSSMQIISHSLHCVVYNSICECNAWYDTNCLQCTAFYLQVYWTMHCVVLPFLCVWFIIWFGVGNKLLWMFFYSRLWSTGLWGHISSDSTKFRFCWSLKIRYDITKVRYVENYAISLLYLS